MEIRVPANYLVHHGVVGMKWGIKNGPPYPLDMTRREYRAAQKEQRLANKETLKPGKIYKYDNGFTLKKGTTLYRTTKDPNESLDGYKYVTFLDVDRNNYRRGNWRRLTGDIHEKSYALKTDLKVPSKNEQHQIIEKILKEQPKVYSKALDIWFKEHFDEWKVEGSPSNQEVFSALTDSSKNYDYYYKYQNFIRDGQKYLDKALKNLKKVPVQDAVFKAFQSLGGNPELHAAIAKELKSRGYNALLDEAGIGGQEKYALEGVAPLVIYEPVSTMFEIGTHTISEKEKIKANGDYYRNMNLRNRSY